VRRDVARGRAAAALPRRLAQLLLRDSGHGLRAVGAGGSPRRQDPLPVPLLPGLQPGARQRLLLRAARPALRPRLLPAVLRGPAGGAPSPGGSALRPDHPRPGHILRTLPRPAPGHQRPPAPSGLRGRSYFFPAGWVCGLKARMGPQWGRGRGRDTTVGTGKWRAAFLTGKDDGRGEGAVTQ
jgi:hypothetical protein